MENGMIREGYNMANGSVFDFVVAEKKGCDKFIVIVEDVKPYNMRITDGIIKTIKVIGQLEWRLLEAGVKFELIPRWQVKQWVFLQYRSIAEPVIVNKIIASRKLKEKKGLKINPNKLSPTFVYVDDRIVASAMRAHWGIEKQKNVGKRTPFNLKDHSWQALGLVSYYIVSHKTSVALK
jgi:hypothetical protein